MHRLRWRMLHNQNVGAYSLWLRGSANHNCVIDVYYELISQNIQLVLTEQRPKLFRTMNPHLKKQNLFTDSSRYLGQYS